MHAGAPPPARSKELSSGPSSSQPARRRGREVLCGTAEKSGARKGFASCREITGCGTIRRSGAAEAVAVSAGASSSRRRLDAEVPQHLPPERPGRLGDAGVLGEQRQQPSILDGGRREDGRDAVQALELLGPMTVASGRRPDAGTLVPQQQGDGLELRAHGRRHAAAPGSRLDLTDGSGEHRDDIAAVVDASLLPQGGTASARLALARSSHRLLLWNAGPRWPRQHAAQSRGRGKERPGQRGWCCQRRADMRISDDRRGQARQAIYTNPEPPAGGLVTTARGKPTPGDRLSFSATAHVNARERAHNSRPHCGRTSSIAADRLPTSAGVVWPSAWLARRTASQASVECGDCYGSPELGGAWHRRPSCVPRPERRTAPRHGCRA